MNPRLLELREQRGILRARCAVQRSAIVAHSTPLLPLFGAADQVRSGVSWVRQHPAVVGIALGILVVLKPRRVWNLGRKGFVFWQLWRNLRRRLSV